MRSLAGMLACLVLAGAVYRGTQETYAQRAARDAARAFAASLTVEQRAAAVLSHADPERRNWHFVPRERRGVALGELTAEQAKLARALLRTALSETGARKVDEIVVLEGVLREIESNPGRDPARYYFTLFGDLAGRDPFGWRFEGHHAALNFSSVGETELAVTPHFLGSNPAQVRGGTHDGLRVLGAEEDLGRELARSFDEKQRAIAVFDRTPPADVIHGPDRAELLASDQGIALAAMTQEQQARFWTLAEVYLARFEAAIAELERARMRSIPPGELRFVWIGSLSPGEPHYYRIQGPRFAIEYDDVQNGANHVHTLWRDFERDFGDPLREHHAREHAK